MNKKSIIWEVSFTIKSLCAFCDSVILDFSWLLMQLHAPVITNIYIYLRNFAIENKSEIYS